ncbi:MAG: CRTAC1 family protein [Aureliella sp.]
MQSLRTAVMITCLSFVLAVFSSGSVFGQTAGREATTAIRLEDVTELSGVQFQHQHGGSGLAYIVEGVSTGIATFDFNGDGWIDIYFLNGAPLRGTAPSESAPTNVLYRNNGDFTFTDVTQESGLGDTGYGLGVTVSDYDGDGDMDVYLNNYGPNVLFQNNGNGTFIDVTAQAGVANGDKVGAGASFFDMDSDGDLDLYVGNYVDFTYENHVEVFVKGRRYHAGPQYYKPVADTLYRNDGGGKFSDVSLESGVGQYAGPSMGLLCADLDQDADIDVYICNDGAENFLFLNNGKGNFEEAGLLSGLGVDFQGANNSSMGVDIGDYDLDGKLDLFTTNYQSELPVLYHNLGDGIFEDVSTVTRVDQGLFANVNWGTAFVDFDLDGDQDLYIACGHFDVVENIDDRTSYKVRNFVLENRGGRFVNVSESCGTALSNVASSRGVAFDDLDNDGDVDGIILNSNSQALVVRNDSQAKGKWASIELTQSGQNPNAVGAKLHVTCGDTTQVRELIAGRGYQSYFGCREYFGFADDGPASVRVVWPDGEKQTFKLKLNERNVLVRKP